MNEFVRVLKPDGIAVLSIPNNWGFTTYHFWDFNLEMLQPPLGSRFDRFDLYYQNSGDRAGCETKGMGPLEDVGAAHAECIVAVCRGPKKEATNSEHARVGAMMEEIYGAVFERHRWFRELHKNRGGRVARLARKIRGVR